MDHETPHDRMAALATLAEEFGYDICANQLGDLEGVRDALVEWIRANPERIDRAI